jgi:2-polyprenyl-3-methyl-5-hydroxy-6-metoxy-1,4-benzoquinol methylase
MEEVSFPDRDSSMRLAPVAPWELPDRRDCNFYHSFDLPNETIIGEWDLRGEFDQYIGGVPLHDKVVLDVGTAGGFLAFSAEQAGARSVTALDVRTLMDQARIPFPSTEYGVNKLHWARDHHQSLVRQKKGFWYCWHALQSKVQIAYCHIDDLLSIKDRFDVVVAGALIEHLADPVSAIGGFCRLARETVILAFTPVDETPGLAMRPAIPWNPEHSYVWWLLTWDLYVQLFDWFGFDVAFPMVSALHVPQGIRVPRRTIVARRR